MIPASCSRALPYAGAGLLVLSPAVFAGTGLNDLGYGAESEAMAGADLAVTHDVYSLNINPAGVAAVDGHFASGDLEPFDYVGNRHRDVFGNDRRPNDPANVVLSGGYAQRLPGTDVSVGVGVFAQGGAGFTYRHLNTAFGTRDDASATFGSFKIEPGLGWQATPQLRLGASVGVVYSLAREKFFPDTSVPASGGNPGFDGFRVDGLSGWSAGGKIGFQYDPVPECTIAAAYTSRTRIKLDDGTATFDDDASGQGRVVYGKASLGGLSFAQEAGIGIAFRPIPALVLTTEFNWVDWSGALKTSTLHVSDPDNASVPQKQDLSSALNWRDMYVVATGLSYDFNQGSTVRLGFNYGRNPIPAQTTNPVLAVIANRAVAAGFSQRLGDHWDASTAVLYQPRIDANYTNPQLPFGPDAQERWDALILQFMLSRRW